MDNNFILTDRLGEIDGKFLDEYYNRRRHRTIKRKNFMKYCTIAASIIIVITLSLVTILPTLRNTPNIPPANTSSGITVNTDNNENNTATNKPDYSNYTVIYAVNSNNDNFTSDAVEGEFVNKPPKPSEVRFDNQSGLYAIMASDDPYDNCLFAVEMSFRMDYSDEYHNLIAESKKHFDEYWDIYKNNFIPHICTHTPNAMNAECEECIRLNNAVETKCTMAYATEAKAHEAHANMITERAESFIASLGLEYKKVKVIWTNEPENADTAESWNFKVFHFTKEQLASFNAPEDLGIEFTLVPEWMDCGEEVIYRSETLYPITLD